MPKKKTEISVVSRVPSSGAAPPRLRVAKVAPESMAGDKYIALMPGTLPGGLHLSIHVSGSVHLRATTPKGVATLDLVEVARRVAKVGPGPLLRLLFRPPSPGHRASAIIVPESASMPMLSPGRVDLDASRLVESFSLVEIEDTCEIIPILKSLRAEGKIRDGDLVQITVPETDEQSFFRPLTGEIQALPDDMPFVEDLRSFQDQVREAGGVFQTVGGKERFMNEMKQVPGYDLIQGFVAEIAAMLEDPSVVAEIERGLMPFVEDLSPEIKSALARGALPTPKEPE